MSNKYELQRNTTEGFASRVRKNLEFTIRKRREGEDVHEVTQLTTSLLGLIVFPPYRISTLSYFHGKAMPWEQWKHGP